MSMRLSILVAMAKNNVIGQDNALPWHLPEDLKHFKTLTMGHPIIMGRRTYESIGKPLPGRTNIIVTRQKGFHAPGIVVVNSIDDALVCGKNVEQASGGDQECFVIGGAELYRQTIQICQRMYITEIQQVFQGDTAFPVFDRNEWQETVREAYTGGGKTNLSYHFVIFDRKNNN